MKTTPQQNNVKYEEIPVNKIDVPHHRERTSEEFSHLVANINKQGLIQPIRVYKQPSGRYTLIYGEGTFNLDITF